MPWDGTPWALLPAVTVEDVRHEGPRATAVVYPCARPTHPKANPWDTKMEGEAVWGMEDREWPPMATGLLFGVVQTSWS